MSDEKFGLDDLIVGDDLDVALDNESYQDQIRNTPVPFGDYSLRLLEVGVVQYRGGEKKGQPILRAGKYPSLEIRMAEIIEGLGDGVTRKVGFLTPDGISTKGFDREGKVVTQANDLARSFGFDDYRTFDEFRSQLKEAIATGRPFAATLDWETNQDTEFVKAAAEQLGLPVNDKGYVVREKLTDEQKKLANLVQYRYSKVQGMGRFPQRDNGSFSPIIVRGNVTMKTDSGDVVIEVPERTLEARNVIPTYFQTLQFISHDVVESGRVKFGPKAAKVRAAA